VAAGLDAGGRRAGLRGAIVCSSFFEQIGQLASRRPWRQNDGTGEGV
jgi:hypothetical protein